MKRCHHPHMDGIWAWESGCRCRRCKLAARERAQQRREEGDASRGTASASMGFPSGIRVMRVRLSRIDGHGCITGTRLLRDDDDIRMALRAMRRELGSLGGLQASARYTCVPLEHSGAGIHPDQTGLQV